MGKAERKAYIQDNDKKLKELWYEYDRVNDAIRGLGWIELENPYQKGWDRYLVLKDDIYNRKDAEVIIKLLKLINVTIHSRDKKFTYRDNKRGGIERPIQQPPKTIGKKIFNELNEQEQSYFTITYDFYKKEWVYTFKYPNFFTFKIVKHMITHKREIDPVLQSQHDKLQDAIYGSGNKRTRLGKIFGWKDNNGWRGKYETRLPSLRNEASFNEMVKEEPLFNNTNTEKYYDE